VRFDKEGMGIINRPLRITPGVSNEAKIRGMLDCRKGGNMTIQDGGRVLSVDMIENEALGVVFLRNIFRRNTISRIIAS